MDEETGLGTSAIIAAYNEEKTLHDVLTALKSSPLIDEIIVVSDGSTDRTVEIARSFEVTTIALRRNCGKGYAMRVGVEYASHDVLFFVDGDMFNLTQHHIESLVQPVLAGRCEMNIGVRNRGPIRNFFHLDMKVGPVLSGIRVMRRAVWATVPLRYQERFKIEAALNFFCSRAGFQQQQTVIYKLGHLIKESKRGLADGLTARWEMVREVFLLHWDLYLFEFWRSDATEPDPLHVAEYDLFE